MNGNSLVNGIVNGTNNNNVKTKSMEEECLGQLGNQHNLYTYEVIENMVKYIQDRTSHRPTIGIICGSGLGALAEMLTERTEYPYSEIPHFPVSTVKGHAGRIIVGLLSGIPVLCMKGRFHSYEGYPLWKCAMPVRMMKISGVTHLIVTNAAGGINPNFKVGDVMILKDHISMLGLAGASPLQGYNDERFGVRFPAMNRAYCSTMHQLALNAGCEVGLRDFLQEGVYAMVGGPSYETIAELKMLRILGVDAVGMSTAPEVITAQHCGMHVLAFSLITNKCILEYNADRETNHEEVIDTANRQEPLLKAFVDKLVQSIAKLPPSEK